MERPDDLTPEQLARMEAEEAIQDDLISHLDLICADVTDAHEMLAEIIELALFTSCAKLNDDSNLRGSCYYNRLNKLQQKCSGWFDLMIERKVHGVPK